jgi:hypothetical protein
MEGNWHCIYSSPRISEVYMMMGILEENEIESVIINKQDSAIVPGEADLHVKTEDVLFALRLISKTES